MDTSSATSEIKPSEVPSQGKSSKKIIFAICGVLLLLVVLVGGVAAGGYFFYLKPNKEKYNKLTQLNDQVSKVNEQAKTVANEYESMKDRILRFQETGNDDDINANNSGINVLGASTQDYSTATEKYLKDLTDKANENLDKLKVKGFSSKNKGVIDELPQTGEDSYIDAVEAARDLASEGNSEVNALQKELDNLKKVYAETNITDSKLKTDYEKLISDTEAYIKEVSNVFKFYEFNLQLSADYYREDAAMYDTLNEMYMSDNPIPYLETLRKNQDAFNAMNDKYSKYDESTIPSDLQSLHELNKSILKITVDYVAKAIDIVENLHSSDEFYYAYRKYYTDRLAENTTYDNKDQQFWKSTSNQDKYDQVDKEINDLTNTIKSLKEKYKSPV